MDRRLTPATDRIALRGWGFAREALTDGRPMRVAAALSDLQDHLGTLNDLETARAMTESLSGPPMPEDDDPGTQDLLEAAADARSELLDIKPFWR